jgi:hypothetical protein
LITSLTLTFDAIRLKKVHSHSVSADSGGMGLHRDAYPENMRLTKIVSIRYDNIKEHTAESEFFSTIGQMDAFIGYRLFRRNCKSPNNDSKIPDNYSKCDDERENVRRC